MRRMGEYAPIMQLMDKVVALAPTTVTMQNLRRLMAGMQLEWSG
jgi:hypothetical protein